MPSEQPDRPADSGWDRLADSTPPQPIPGVGESRHGDDGPLVVTLFAATWADIVALAAVSTGALLTLVLFGHHTTTAAFPWAVALALMWWSLSGTVTLVVRRGTPGMLAAGLVFERHLRPSRVPAVLATAVAQCLTLGLTAFLGAQRSPLRLASGIPLDHLD